MADSDHVSSFAARLARLAARMDDPARKGELLAASHELDRLAAWNARLHEALRTSADDYRASLAAFAKFRTAARRVQAMRSLDELGAALADLRLILAMPEVHLVLEAQFFAPLSPDGARFVPAAELAPRLAELAAATPSRAYIGSLAKAPAGGYFLPGLEATGSCYIQPLADKYDPARHIGAAALYDPDPTRFCPDKATDFLEHFLESTACALAAVRDHGRLELEATIDKLTGAHNRTYLMRHAPRLLSFAHRKGFPLACLFIDLDDFKPVNDTLGHRAGDMVLAAVAQAFAAEVRGYDIFARLGGDEFVVVAPDTDEDRAKRLAARLRELVAGIDTAGLCGADSAPRVSASVGLAMYRPPETLQELLTRADAAMYQAKRTSTAKAL